MVDTKSFYRSLDLQKNEVKNIVIENLSTEPINPESGQIYYNNSDNNLYLYNGSTFEVILSGVGTSNLYHAIGINSTPGTVTSYYPIFQTATTTNSNIYSYSTPSASSNTGFKLLKAGKYKISYTINWVNQSYNNRVNYFSRIMKHSSAITPSQTEISGTRSFAYSRDANFVKYATTTCTSVIDVSANEYIKIMTQVSKNDTDFNDSFDGIVYLQDSAIVIEYLGDI
jgi:hypothetical protein